MQTSKTYKLYPGDIKFEDLNGNGYIDRGQNTVDDPGDRKIIGNEEPRYIYSFTLSADWNNIWVSAFFQGVGKQDWYPSNEASTFWGQYNRPYNQVPTWHLNNYWTEDNPNAKYPRLTTHQNRSHWNYENNDFMLQNNRYIRLKSLIVGYTLPQTWTRKAKLEKVRIYFSGNDLWEATSIADGFDPEMGETSNNNGYPFSRTWSFGVNIGF